MTVEIDSDPPSFALGVFSDQAYNSILLAQDEARMLGQRIVEPEHVLLALAREGNVERLLQGANVRAGDIYPASPRPISREHVGELPGAEEAQT